MCSAQNISCLRALVTEVAVVITVENSMTTFLILAARMVLLQYGSEVTNPVYGGATEKGFLSSLLFCCLLLNKRMFGT